MNGVFYRALHLEGHAGHAEQMANRLRVFLARELAKATRSPPAACIATSALVRAAVAKTSELKTKTRLIVIETSRPLSAAVL
jgi:hypothetical protein